jgi:hypothetical protein
MQVARSGDDLVKRPGGTTEGGKGKLHELLLRKCLKISDRDPKGFAGKPKNISGRLAAQLVNALRQKNL